MSETTEKAPVKKPAARTRKKTTAPTDAASPPAASAEIKEIKAEPKMSPPYRR